jgi:hypothetical protein
LKGCIRRRAKDLSSADSHSVRGAATPRARQFSHHPALLASHAGGAGEGGGELGRAPAGGAQHAGGKARWNARCSRDCSRRLSLRWRWPEQILPIREDLQPVRGPLLLHPRNQYCLKLGRYVRLQRGQRYHHQRHRRGRERVGTITPGWRRRKSGKVHVDELLGASAEFRCRFGAHAWSVCCTLQFVAVRYCLGSWGGVHVALTTC